jgi:hypothetical protein
MAFHAAEQYRCNFNGDPRWNSTKEDGNNGCFRVPMETVVETSEEMHKNASRLGVLDLPAKLLYTTRLHVIASDYEAMGWEHVSVSVAEGGRCPTWEEMCFIKDLFWDDTDCVMQLHPPKSDYVNTHHYVLHLWRPIFQPIPRPPKELV